MRGAGTVLGGIGWPKDGKRYAISRAISGAYSLSEITAGEGGGVPEAPQDSKPYARRNASWSEATPSLVGAAAADHSHALQAHAATHAAGQPDAITPTAIGASPSDHTHSAYQAAAEKGQANGYAGLDANSKVPPANLGGSCGDASKVLDGSGAWVTKPTSDANGYVTLGADRSNNTTSFADCTGLGFTALAGKTYLVEFFVKFIANATTTGIQLGVNGDVALGELAGDIVGYTAGTTIAGRHFNTYNESGKSLSASLAGTNFATVRCLFKAGASNTAFVLRFAAEASTSGTSVTIKAGSFLRYRQVD